MEWFIDRFHPNDVKIPSMVHEFLRSKISAEEKIEGCKWLSQKFPFLEWKFGVYDGITLTWLMQHGLSKPSQHSLLSAYYYICDVNLVKWILDEFHIPVPGWELFFTVFGNWEDSVAVAKLMVQRATKLPPKVITTSIENALSVGNTAVAGWLEQTFHIIEGTPKDKLAVALTQASRKSFQWLLQHIQTESLEEEVNLALESHTLPNEVDCTLNLLQSFPLTRQRDATETRWNKFLHALALADLPSAQRICSLAEFTQSDVVRCFAPDVQVQSSKVIKWLIEKYNLTADHIKGNNIAVLCRLLSLSKTGCAEWLIKKFHITWDEVATVYWDPRFIKLSTWRMLMRIFPELTTDYIREHYMSAFTATPLNISYAIQVLGITEAEIVDYCRRRKAERGWLLEGTELWLGAHNLHL
ncbi:hypothetical protein Pelo_18946 [Pelomyxa schiedti]|nr:hypothetical protein Pelo_18946 [Pelomyxa schiedti]